MATTELHCWSHDRATIHMTSSSSTTTTTYLSSLRLLLFLSRRSALRGYSLTTRSLGGVDLPECVLSLWILRGDFFRRSTTSPVEVMEEEEVVELRTTPSRFSSDGRSQHTWFCTGVVVASALVLAAVCVHVHVYSHLHVVNITVCILH